MKKLTDLHLKVIVELDEDKESLHYKINVHKAATKSAEITEQISIGFAGFCLLYPKNTNLNTKEIFQEYLKKL